MRKVSIAIAFILALWNCFGFAQTPSVPVEKTVPAQTLSPPVKGSGEASQTSKPMTDIHDIKPLASVPIPIAWATIALWTAACIAVGGLLVGAWFLWRRRHGPTVEAVEAVLSPEETALQRLASLSAETGMEGKAFYFQLSFIFREYLQGRFGIDGLEMTTEELLPHVERLKLDRDLKRDSKNFIVSCDPVKYASALTFQESMATDFKFVKSFVEVTTAPVEDSTEAESGQDGSVPE
jgi:hypothetical protein